MVNKLESLVKKHKALRKHLIIGKVLGGVAGIVTGFFVGGEILQLFNSEYSNYVMFGAKISPIIIMPYIGQKIGGLAGTGYYFLNRRKKNRNNYSDSQSL